MSEAKPIGPGLCHCGCGGRTGIIARSIPQFGWVKGRPKRYINGHQRRHKVSDQERFDSYIYPDPNTGCLLFAGTEANGGYGMIVITNRINGSKKIVRAHHFAWAAAGRGDVPKGMILRHKCDTPCCCNVDHLLLGTHKENSGDMCRRGRARRGSGTLPVGVYRSGARFKVALGSTGSKRYRGSFATLEEAAAVAGAVVKEIYREVSLHA